jgi:hypothetical protein
VTEEMSGGLSHHTDEENGPSHTVGHKSSKQQGCYSLERNQCACADAIRVPANYKKKRTSLDMTDVVRDVEKVAFLENLPKFGDGKCPGDPRESFIANPGAILFGDFSGGSFSTATPVYANYDLFQDSTFDGLVVNHLREMGSRKSHGSMSVRFDWQLTDERTMPLFSHVLTPNRI